MMLAAWPDCASPQAQSASYTITRQTMDGGGGRTRSATYGLEATVGQADAGPAMSSPTDALRGGFHRASAGVATDTLFRDGFEPL
jgi:hypothetical protein